MVQQVGFEMFDVILGAISLVLALVILAVMPHIMAVTIMRTSIKWPKVGRVLLAVYLEYDEAQIDEFYRKVSKG